MTACSTDGNVKSGVSITATGDSPLLINGLYARRDGANGTSGGGGYAGVLCSGSTIPVILDDVIVIPGVAQTGGANSPQYGVAITSSAANVSVRGGLLHAATTGYYDDGSNINIRRGPNIVERVGTQTSYTTAFNGLQIASNGLDMVGEALGIPTPRDSGLVAWTCDPRSVTGSSGDTVPSSGVWYLSAFYVPRTVPVTSVYFGVVAAASGQTAGENFFAVFSSSGAVVASVGIDAKLTGTGSQTATLSSTTLTPGWYWAAVVQNATTPAKLYRSSNNLLVGTVFNWGISAAAQKAVATNGSGVTAVGAITPSSNGAGSPAYCYAFAIGP
jgi:hypothetical protein